MLQRDAAEARPRLTPDKLAILVHQIRVKEGLALIQKTVPEKKFRAVLPIEIVTNPSWFTYRVSSATVAGFQPDAAANISRDK